LIGLVRESEFGLTRWALAFFIVASEIVFLYFMAPAGTEFALSSLVLTAALLFQLRFGMRRDAPTPADMIVFIFDWLFLDLAPKIQLISVPDRLVNTSTVRPEMVLATNLLCALFIVSFTLIYARMRREAPARGTPGETQPAAPKAGAPARRRFTPMGVLMTLGLCLVLVAALGRTPYGTDTTETMAPSAMMVKKFLLFIPTATLFILLHETIRTRGWAFTRICVLLVLMALLLVTENTITEKRNALGPIYLGLIFILFQPRLRGENARLCLLIASMVLIFPAATLFTHNHTHAGVTFDAAIDAIKDHYFSTHYDAWANIYTCVEMVTKQGLHWGQQLLGDFLFFVPSGVWHAKPLATGIAIGNYLILNYGMWFTNLSAPLVGEAYIDFGVIGVPVYAAALAAVVAWLNRAAPDRGRWVSYPFAIFFALFLMFALRGSLMIAFAYGTGAILAFFTASSVLSVGLPGAAQRYFIAGASAREDVDLPAAGLRRPAQPAG
jgi:hypothetical protein